MNAPLNPTRDNRALRVVLVTAGILPGSHTDDLAAYLADALHEHPELAAHPEHLHHLQIAPLANSLLHTHLGGEPDAAASHVIQIMEQADLVVAVTPIYNGSYSGLFKTFVDVLPLGTLRGTAVVLAATGGTPRHTLAIDMSLRPLFTYLGSMIAPTAIFSTRSDWTPERAEQTRQRIGRAIDEGIQLAGNRRERSSE